MSYREIGLSALLHGGGGEDGRSLPQLMRALERNEITAPLPDDLDALTSAPSSPQPRPAKPARLSEWQEEIRWQEHLQAQQDQVDRQEIAVRLRAKRLSLASYPRGSVVDTKQRSEIDQRLAQAETELKNWR
jgi:hypothetical protein